jgi:hypothetical protein
MAHTNVASVNRYRTGACETVVMPDNASYPINVGDILYQVSGTVYPASALANQGSQALNQAYLAAHFAGIALSKDGLQTGETSARLTTAKGHVLVGVSGDFEFPCAATAFKTGDYVGGLNITTGSANTLEDQKVAKVTLDSAAIGIAKVAVNDIGATITSVIVSIKSPLMDEGVTSGE